MRKYDRIEEGSLDKGRGSYADVILSERSLLSMMYEIGAILTAALLTAILIYFRNFFRLSGIGLLLLIVPLWLVHLFFFFLMEKIGYYIFPLLAILFIPFAYLAPKLGKKRRFSHLPKGPSAPSATTVEQG